MGVGPLCWLHPLSVCVDIKKKKKKEPYWFHHFIQPEGNSLKRANALTGGPSSVQTLLPLPDKAARRSGRQVEQAVWSRRRGPVYARAPQRLQAGMCPLQCESQQGHTVRHVSGPSRHKQMFSGYRCSASLVIVFLQGQPVGQGARLCCGKELWRNGKDSVLSISHGFGGCSTQTARLFP